MPIKSIKSTVKYLLPLILLLVLSSCSYFRSTDIDSSVFEPEASLEKADQLIKKGFYEDARKILEDIKARDASQKYAAIATLRIADTYYEDGSYEEAVVEYESFLKLHRYHKYAPYAQYKLAMSYFKRIKTVDVSYSWASRALKEFEELRRRYPRNPYMDITESRIRTCRRILAEYEFYVGNFYFRKGSYRAAAQRFEGLIRNYPGSKKEPDALYYLGLSYEKMGRQEDALNVLTSLIEKFPTMELSTKAKKRIALLEGKGPS
ncbi:MAG: tetratricopeptide repeat protein [Deferribacteres bacterium]|nr:tetratricopeptide repeat protein [Deferribacteres bacterium]